MVEVAVAAAVLVVILVVVMVRRRTGPVDKRGESDTALRDAFVGILMTVGPFFGVRYRPPRVDIPVAAVPAPDDLDPGVDSGDGAPPAPPERDAPDS